jgi:hypothetical protein
VTIGCLLKNQFCLYFETGKLLILRQLKRGALNLRAEIKPIEPDPGNAGEGN